MSSLTIRKNSIVVVLLMHFYFLETPKLVGHDSCLTGLKLKTIDTRATEMHVWWTNPWQILADNVDISTEWQTRKISRTPGWVYSYELCLVIPTTAGNVTVPLLLPPLLSCKEGVFSSFGRVSWLQWSIARQPWEDTPLRVESSSCTLMGWNWHFKH